MCYVYVFLNECVNSCTTICILLLKWERIVSTSSISQRIRNKFISEFMDIQVCNFSPRYSQIRKIMTIFLHSEPFLARTFNLRVC